MVAWKTISKSQLVKYNLKWDIRIWRTHSGMGFQGTMHMPFQTNLSHCYIYHHILFGKMYPTQLLAFVLIYIPFYNCYPYRNYYDPQSAYNPFHNVSLSKSGESFVEMGIPFSLTWVWPDMFFQGLQPRNNLLKAKSLIVGLPRRLYKIAAL